MRDRDSSGPAHGNHRAVTLSPLHYVVLFVAGFAIPMLMAAYTDNAWEDWYITFRASQNLAEGHGLVFTEGQRVHTFTSPIGVLVPAGMSYLVGSEQERLALWLYRG